MKREAPENNNGLDCHPAAATDDDEVAASASAPVERSFAAGQIVFECKPFVAVLDRKWKFSRCDHCFTPFPAPPGTPDAPRPLTCPECAACLYCDGGCRREALPDHRHECLYLRQKGKSIISDTGRFMMKLILKLRFEPEERLQERVLGSTRKFSELLHHYERIAKDERRLSTILEIREELLRYRLKELPDSEEEFIQLGGKVLINSFNYTNESNERLGTALYLGASMLDHSCLPNAAFSFRKGRISVRALENIDLGKDRRPQDVITISYMNLMDSAANRRERLESLYYFSCHCRRCLNPHMDWPLYSMRCQTVTCLGKPVFVGSGKCAGDLEAKPCSECGNKPKLAHLEKYLTICKECEVTLTNATSLAAVEETLKSMVSFLHQDHYLYTKAAKWAFEEHLLIKNYEEARNYALLCLNAYRKYKSAVWPQYGLLLLRLGRLELLNMSALPRKVSSIHLEEAKKVIKVTHGEEHELFREAVQLAAKAALI